MAENNKKTPLKIAVIGVGIMGMHHLRIYHSLKNVEVVAVVDTNEDRVKSVAEEYGCEGYTDFQQIIGKVDAASIATTSITHYKIGELLLNKGIHCLMEKPLAITENECQEMINASEKSGAILMVGHIEQFNPSVQALAEILSNGDYIQAIETRRMSAASNRIEDVDVIMDLMIHDIEIVLSLIKSPVTNIDAQAVSKGSKGNDYVTALLSFENGAIANLTASRITQNKIRTLDVTSTLGFMSLDFMDQSLCIYHQGRNPMFEKKEPPVWANYPVDISMEKVAVRNKDQLTLELRHFVAKCIKNEKPLITGQDALNTLKVVWQIQEKI